MVLCLALLGGGRDSSAAPGDLDTTFATTGWVAESSIVHWVAAPVVAVQSDGKILVATDTYATSANELAVLRYLSNGSLDTAWGTGGIAAVELTNDGSSEQSATLGIAIQSDGKVLVAVAVTSIGQIEVLRFDSTGAVDTTWGTGGVVATGLDGGGLGALGDVLLLPGGKVVVGGTLSGDFALARYTSAGALDTAFGSGGIATIDPGSGAGILFRLALQDDGKILATGAVDGSIVTTRFESSGAADSSFGSSGVVLSTAGSEGRDVVQQPDGKVLVLGTTNNVQPPVLTIRYEADGTVDTSWGASGVATTHLPGPAPYAYPDAILLQPDEKAIVAALGTEDITGGLDYDVVTIRYETDGSLDTSWGGTGIVMTDLTVPPMPYEVERGRDATLDASNRLLVVGSKGPSFAQNPLVLRYDVGEYCGDGFVQAGEDCDDGNVADGDCCSSTCTYESSGSPCDDGNVCTDEACDGAGACAQTACNVGQVCGSACGTQIPCTNMNGDCKCGG